MLVLQIIKQNFSGNIDGIEIFKIVEEIRPKISKLSRQFGNN